MEIIVLVQMLVLVAGLMLWIWLHKYYVKLMLCIKKEDVENAVIADAIKRYYECISLDVHINRTDRFIENVMDRYRLYGLKLRVWHIMAREIKWVLLLVEVLTGVAAFVANAQSTRRAGVQSGQGMWFVFLYITLALVSFSALYMAENYAEIEKIRHQSAMNLAGLLARYEFDVMDGRAGAQIKGNAKDGKTRPDRGAASQIKRMQKGIERYERLALKKGV